MLTLAAASARCQICTPVWIFQEALGLFAQVGHPAPENEWHLCIYVGKQSRARLPLTFTEKNLTSLHLPEKS